MQNDKKRQRENISHTFVNITGRVPPGPTSMFLPDLFLYVHVNGARLSVYFPFGVRNAIFEEEEESIFN